MRLRGARALSWRLFLRRHSDLGLTRQPLGGDNERKMTSCIGSSFIKHWERQLSTEKRSAQPGKPLLTITSNCDIFGLKIICVIIG